MDDVEDLVHYIRCLKAGFDVDEFKNKLKELSDVVEGPGIDYENFHTLFKVWLSLSIAITKWKNIGECVIPQERIEPCTVKYAIRWLLASYEDQTSYSRIAFVLDWLTAAMDTDSIDIVTLNSGYEVFYTIFQFNILAPHVLKLLYTLSTPSDVNRRRVLNLIALAQMREEKRSDLRGVQVLLGLFKSYKPELVPESVPAVPINSCFKKLNATIMYRFKANQIRRNISIEKPRRLQWMNPNTVHNHERRKHLPALIPNMQFTHVGSKQYSESELQKNYLDFTNPESLLAYGSRYELSRPARLRSLLLQDAAVPLLVASPQQHAFMNHDLHYVLSYCFLQDYPYKYEEKCNFLSQLAKFQKVIQQGIPAVTAFLAQYLPFWNEKDFFSEILNLVEWICVEPNEHVLSIVNTLGRIFVRAQAMEQVAILKTFTNLYDNLARTSIRKKQYFLKTEVSKTQAEVVHNLSKCIDNVCNAALQMNSGDLRILWAATEALQWKGRSSLRHGVLGIDLHPTVCVLTLVTPSAVLLEKLAELLLIHWKLLNKRSEHSEDLLPLLQACTVDMMNCLWESRALSKREDGLAFISMTQEAADVFIEKLSGDQIFSLGSHLGLAPYTYVQLKGIDLKDVDRKLLFKMAIASNFPSLSRLFGKIINVEQ